MISAINPHLRVLIVDDHAFIREVLQSVLLKLRLKDVAQASNGAEAIEVLETKKIDCILSDLNMGPVNGLELLRAVRAGKVTGCEPDTCFIIVTAEADQDVVNVATALDVNGYVVKPISSEKLFSTIASAAARPWQLKSPLHYQSIETMTAREQSLTHNDQSR